MVAGALTADVAALLERSGRRTRSLALEPCGGGGNNRVFVVHAGGERLVVKQYFRHPSDPRDRLAAEFGFLEYARDCGVADVPLPIRADPERGLALYEFVEGRRIEPGRVKPRHVDAAARFFADINRAVFRAAACRLPAASEACFSIEEHVALVERRLARLDRIAPGSAANDGALGFAAELRRAWTAVRAGVESGRARGVVDPLPEALRCVSPSDFGFHNALERADGRLCFLDFEYAGLDDPAKMAGDFFAHPAVPVPSLHERRFVERALGALPEAAALAERARLLEPLFRIKWCCIMLNEFLPDDARRRRFAEPGADDEARKRRQLDKARRHLVPVFDA